MYTRSRNTRDVPRRAWHLYRWTRNYRCAQRMQTCVFVFFKSFFKGLGPWAILCLTLQHLSASQGNARPAYKCRCPSSLALWAQIARHGFQYALRHNLYPASYDQRRRNLNNPNY